MESLKVNESNEETRSDMEVTVEEANTSTNPDESIPVIEGGLKDPSDRRQELLVKSGLAKVCCFNIPVYSFEFSIIFEIHYLHTVVALLSSFWLSSCK